MKNWILPGFVTLLAFTSAQAADPLESSLQICSSCHGSAGKPSDPTIPIIFGQQARYLEKQLKDYRSGDRDSQIMSSMAEAVPFKDLGRATDLLASRPWLKRCPSRIWVVPRICWPRVHGQRGREPPRPSHLRLPRARDATVRISKVVRVPKESRLVWPGSLPTTCPTRCLASHAVHARISRRCRP